MESTTEHPTAQPHAKITPREKDAWLLALLADGSLNLSAKVVGTRLLLYRNHETGRLQVRQEVLADAIGLKRQTVNEALGKLRKGEWIDISEKGRGSSSYTIRFDRVAASRGAEMSVGDDIRCSSGPTSDVAVDRHQLSSQTDMELLFLNPGRGTPDLNKAPAEAVKASEIDGGAGLSEGPEMASADVVVKEPEREKSAGPSGAPESKPQEQPSIEAETTTREASAGQPRSPEPAPAQTASTVPETRPPQPANDDVERFETIEGMRISARQIEDWGRFFPNINVLGQLPGLVKWTCRAGIKPGDQISAITSVLAKKDEKAHLENQERRANAEARASAPPSAESRRTSRYQIL